MQCRSCGMTGSDEQNSIGFVCYGADKFNRLLTVGRSGRYIFRRKLKAKQDLQNMKNEKRPFSGNHTEVMTWTGLLTGPQSRNDDCRCKTILQVLLIRLFYSFNRWGSRSESLLYGFKECKSLVSYRPLQRHTYN